MGQSQVTRFATVTLLVVVASPVFAGIELSVSPSISATDNALRTENNEISERRYEVGATIAADYETATLKLDGRYYLARKWFSEDSADDRNSRTGEVELRWQQIEHRLRWELSNSTTRVLRDNTRAGAEFNTEDRSISTIAAVLTLGSDTSYLTLTPRFVDTRYQETDASDQQRDSVEISFGRRLSPLTRLVLTAVDEKVDTESTLATADYDKRTYSIGFQRELRRLSYALSVGRSEVERSTVEDVDSEFWSARIAYDYGPQQLTVATSRSVTDTGFGNGNLRISGITVTDEGDLLLDIARDPDTPDIVILTRYGLAWQDDVLCTRCRLNVSFDIDNSEFVTRDETEEEWRASWDFSRDITSTNSVGFLISPRKVDFSGARDSADYDALLWRASASREVSDDLDVYARLERETRDGASLDYDVTTAVIGFHWRLLD